MKKSSMIFLLINIFFLMVASVFSDYSTLDSRTSQLGSTVSRSTDSALSAVLSAEDFFSGSGSGAQVTMSVWGGSSFTTGNLYMISFYLSDRGNIPTQAEYNGFVASIGGAGNIEEYVYSRLYGNPSTRIPTAKFKAFYDSIGQFMTTSTFVRDTTLGAFGSTALDFPVLAKMGLVLSPVNTGGRYILGTPNSFDNVGSSGGSGETYYLSPSSVGVTYIDESLLRSTIYCMMDTAIRCNKVGTMTNASFSSADGTLPISVRDSGVMQSQRNSSGHTIVNDGSVEYLLDTLDVGVTYYMVDIWDNANWEVVNYIMGSTVGKDAHTLPQRLRDSSKQVNIYGVKPASYYVLVAKVDVSVDVSIPYRSSFLQWNRYRNSSSGDEFFGILELDAGGNLSSSDDGMQYKYTTFTAVTN